MIGRFTAFCPSSHLQAVMLQVTVIAIGAFSMQQWRGPAWNSPIWPMLPLLLNRFIEIVALLLKNHFISITVSL